MARLKARSAATHAAAKKTVVALLLDEKLPGPADYEALIPPRGDLILVRRALGANAWIWFRFDEATVTFVEVTVSPPHPYDHGPEVPDGPDDGSDGDDFG